MVKGKEMNVLTLQQLWDEGRNRLQQAQVTEYDLDARYLLLEAFEIDFTHFLIKRNENLDITDKRVLCAKERYEDWIKKRSKRIPLQHLTGKQAFMGLEFTVNEHVLIPRQDTETLAELVMKCCPERGCDSSATRLLDMCTGSGCIAVSLFMLGGFRDVTAADISLPALKTAYANVSNCMAHSDNRIVKAAHKTISDSPWKVENIWEITGETGSFINKFTLIESDLFQNLDKSLKYDIIVSNPPYIATEVIEKLEPEVRDHEPRLALDGTADGLHFYRRLAEEGKTYLRDQGHMFLEIGYDQGEAVTRLLMEKGYKVIEIVKDASGLDRVVHACVTGSM
ncbi:peptide chain release factor N(5)-glutamine methyltransferase [Clostridium sp. AM58-1XD]|nr:peptide chain release factor N(5)-glutamine methyltransferase [Clostridium sp. AM58-1XD]